MAQREHFCTKKLFLRERTDLTYLVQIWTFMSENNLREAEVLSEEWECQLSDLVIN